MSDTHLKTTSRSAELRSSRYRRLSPSVMLPLHRICSQFHWPPSLKSPEYPHFTSCLNLVASLELKKKAMRLRIK